MTSDTIQQALPGTVPMSSKTAHPHDRVALHIGAISEFHRHAQSVSDQRDPQPAENAITLCFDGCFG